MIVLVIETATAACSVALLDGDRVVAARHELVGRGHAERLVPMIGEVLDEAGVNRANLIQVDCGPGSFTGIRVGIAAARGLSLAWGVPVAGFSALSLIAVTAREDVTVAITGGHGELFVQRFEHAPFAAADALRSLRPEAAADLIADDLVLGSGAEALVAARGTGRAQAAFPNAVDARLLPAELTSLAAVPLYGRAPDAKIPQ
ncbi:MAG: tRNA (adenosine(37)-N6)-threonylcarbamoyltransferase complex dimerization subunit type 1 TsaB [Sphingomonas sp.]|nr:tRNA (adenosine(37)-N6)-threonylcarbamoyltransferase complex dimerization subunit type 1 TsaB [Sphingomonas sp.]